MKALRLLAVLVIAMAASICSAQSGYKGMIEGGYMFNLERTEASVHTIEFSTTHGYQFNPYLFIGAGVGLNLVSSPVDVMYMPLYLDVKANLTKTKISPFIELKIGHTVLDVESFYLNPNIGVNYNFYKSLSAYLKVGYTYVAENCDVYGSDTYDGISVRIGFEF